MNQNIKSTALELFAASVPSRYEFRALLKEGGASSLYHAFDQLLSREVAIKLWHLERASPASDSTFLTEAKALASLNHQNIVRIHSFDLGKNGEPYLVMEFLAGESLAAELSRGPLSSERIYAVFRQVLSGLIHAHSRKIVHRDLKPANIMISPLEEGLFIARIIDFDIAGLDVEGGSKRNSEDSFKSDVPVNSPDPAVGRLAAKAPAGSPNYMSPEQCRSELLDERSDIYSLGCTLYECASGKPPFPADSALETMYRHLNEAPPPLKIVASEKVSERLRRLIACCLQKEPCRRPQSAADVLSELDDSLRENSSSSRFRIIRLPSIKMALPFFLSALLLVLMASLIVISKMRFNMPGGPRNLRATSDLTGMKSEKKRDTERLEKDVVRWKKRWEQSGHRDDELENLTMQYSKLADNYNDNGAVLDSTRVLREALELNRSNTRKSARVRLLSFLADNYRRLNDCEKSYELLHQACDLASSIDENTGQLARSRFDLIGICIRLGKDSEARAILCQQKRLMHFPQTAPEQKLLYNIANFGAGRTIRANVENVKGVCDIVWTEHGKSVLSPAQRAGLVSLIHDAALILLEYRSSEAVAALGESRQLLAALPPGTAGLQAISLRQKELEERAAKEQPSSVNWNP